MRVRASESVENPHLLKNRLEWHELGPPIGLDISDFGGEEFGDKGDECGHKF